MNAIGRMRRRVADLAFCARGAGVRGPRSRFGGVAPASSGGEIMNAIGRMRRRVADLAFCARGAGVRGPRSRFGGVAPASNEALR